MAFSNNNLLPFFDGEDYEYWKIKMKTVLRAEGLWSIVENGYEEPKDENSLTDDEKKKLESSRKKNASALNKIQMGVSKTIFTRISRTETSKEAWDILEAEFFGDERVRTINLHTLKRDFQNLKMKDSENIQDYHAKVMEIVNQMRNYGDTISDQQVVEKMLISLTDKYDHIVTVIEETKDISTLTVKGLMSSLLAHEKRRLKQVESSSETAFQSKATPPSKFVKKGEQQKLHFQRKPDSNKTKEHSSERGANFKPACKVCGRNNHATEKCWHKGKPKCNYCKRFNHLEKDCRFKNKDKEHANFSKEKEEENLFYACHTATCKDDVWYIDSGCSNHMSGNTKVFVDLDTSINTKVSMGNGAIVEAQGKGTVAVFTNKGVKYIHDVLLVPDLEQSLLSVGQLMEKGYQVLFQDGSCKIYDSKKPAHPIAEVAMEKNRNFPLRLQYKALKAEASNESWIWHKRFCHLNFNGLKLLKKKSMVYGLPEIQTNVAPCEACIMGKQHRKPFPKEGSSRARAPLELIHTDICGFMKTLSLGQQRYFLLFIDDYSRMTWVYFLKEKSDTLMVFKRFKALVEKQRGFNIKRIRSDRGGEYTSQEFEEYCKDEGIWKELTAGYSAQQNGVAERKNRTVVEIARAIMNEKGLPKKFWAEAVNTAVYILNRCPTKAVKNRTPYEAWTGRKPSVSHLKIFGCICYAHIPSQKRTKLDEKSVKCIFLGYSPDAKAYRLYNIDTNKLVVSRDVIFHEDAAWDWKQKQVDETHVTHPTISSFNDEEEEEQGRTPEEETQFSSDDEDSPPKRTRRLSDIYASCNFVLIEPSTFEEAAKYDEWRKAMEEEMHMIKKNNTWELVEKPQGRKIVGLKWIYKIKLNQNGEVQKYKARLVAKGFTQKSGIDYFETFSPVARMETIRTLIALAAQKQWKFYQLDVKSAFLNGRLKEEIYVEQPQGFLVKGGENKVYKLNKALYGLKQAPRAWYNEIDSYFLKNGFSRSKSEATLYVKKDGSDILICSLYVDDLIFAGNNGRMMHKFKEDMMKTYEMTDLGLLHYFLGIEVAQGDEGIFISQKKYTKSILEKFNMSNCNPVSTPLDMNEKLKRDDGAKKVDSSLYKSLVGSLMYLTSTRPDIMFATSLLSRFSHQPSQIHFGVAKRVLRYLQGTRDYGIMYKAGANSELIAYSDSDLAGSVDDMKSTTGYAFLFGSSICAWMSKKQKTVAQSTAEAEYIAAAKTASQAIWMQRILEDIGEKQEGGTTLFCDNTAAIDIAKNPISNERSKHILIKYHFIREAHENGNIRLKHCKSQDQLADIFTKPLPRQRFYYLREHIGITKKTH